MFRRFEADSTVAAHWLKTHDKTRYALKIAAAHEADAEDLENEEDEWLKQDDEGTELGGTNRFVDRLLNIAKEARLLVECKDIQDELGILTMVLRQQKATLQEMERSFAETLVADDDKRFDLLRKLSQQKALLDLHVADNERMDKAAKSVNISLSQVLDLKQKHANALEVCILTSLPLQILTLPGALHTRSSTKHSEARPDYHGLHNRHHHFSPNVFHGRLLRHRHH